ncbi:MAG: OmpA family protein [Chitinophagales bacterium]|nr:OmpA family protein [Chitinophagales bacterium]
MRILLTCIFLIILQNVISQEVEKKFVIYFATNEFQVSSAQKANITSFLDIVAAQSMVVKEIKIFGFADGVGSEKSNMLLSKQRANEVKTFMKGLGYENEVIIWCEGKGELGADVPNEDYRRVEVIFVFESKQKEFFKSEISEEVLSDNIKSEQLVNLMKGLALPYQEFTVDNRFDTVLVGEKGSLLFIDANIFNVTNKEKERIVIKIKEVYKKSEMIREMLSTLTNKDEILQTQGMIELRAFINNKEVGFLPTKAIRVMVPNKSELTESLQFDGVRNDDSVMRWLPNNNNAISTTNGFLLNNSICSDMNNQNIGSYSRIKLMFTSIGGAFSTKVRSNNRKARAWLRDQKRVKRMTKKEGKSSDNCTELNKLMGILGLSPTDKENGLKALLKKYNAKDEVELIEILKRKVKDDYLAGTLKSDKLEYFVTTFTSVGWKNLDVYMKQFEPKDLTAVAVDPNLRINIVQSFLIINEMDALLSGFYYFSNVPRKRHCTYVCFKKVDKQFQMGKVDVYDTDKIQAIEFKALGFEEIIKELDNLD